jgi:hypothetical protein
MTTETESHETSVVASAADATGPVADDTADASAEVADAVTEIPRELKTGDLSRAGKPWEKYEIDLLRAYKEDKDSRQGYKVIAPKLFRTPDECQAQWEKMKPKSKKRKKNSSTAAAAAAASATPTSTTTTVVSRVNTPTAPPMPQSPVTDLTLDDLHLHEEESSHPGKMFPLEAFMRIGFFSFFETDREVLRTRAIEARDVAAHYAELEAQRFAATNEDEDSVKRSSSIAKRWKYAVAAFGTEEDDEMYSV